MGECPYLQGTDAPRRYPVAGYCLGYRDGRLRIPSMAEFTRYCTSPLHVECNVYRVRLAQDAEGPAQPRAAA